MSDTTNPVEAAHAHLAELFETHADVFGDDLAGYSGHAQRMVALVGRSAEVSDDMARPLAIAAFYHDAAIWFDGTWDYLGPSAERARAELGDADPLTVDVVTAMVDEHHRIRRARHDHPLVEAFRLADRKDVYFGLPSMPGVDRAAYAEIKERFPIAGLRPMLARAFGRGLRERPTRPMPMVEF